MSQKGTVLYLHVHQPWRIRDYSIFDAAQHHDYFDDMSETERNNRAVFLKVADKSYRPMNILLQKLLAEQPDFRFSLSITGTFIEQAKRFAPDVLDSFKALVDTGRVEIVGETYHHSLAFFYSREEFERQVSLHAELIKSVFGVEPTAFRNTELAYNDELAKWADSRGYKAILSEGWDPVLEWRSPNHVYQPAGTSSIALLTKNYRLSDDLAFRFGNKAWEQWPLSVGTYERWLDASLEHGNVVNLFMDYETFGEHQWEDTGIFGFFHDFVSRWAQRADRAFYTVTEAASTFEKAGELSMPHTVTWADSERDLTAWLGNSMQQESLKYLYALEHDIIRSKDQRLMADWRQLQTSDHVYYMCTKWFRDGDVHAYFSPYDSPYDAFLYFMNALRDMRYRLMHYHSSSNGGF
ncbi:MAG: glycoside hydrolase family 57 protein [Candidatus Saccharimonadales bacterium]